MGSVVEKQGEDNFVLWGVYRYLNFQAPFLDGRLTFLSHRMHHTWEPQREISM